jgi:FkbM family methyltransferase
VHHTVIKDLVGYLGSDALYLLAKLGGRERRLRLLRRAFRLFDQNANVEIDLIRLLADGADTTGEIDAVAARFAHRFATALRQTRPAAPGEQLAFGRFLIKHAEQSFAQNFQDLWVMFESGSQRAGFFVEFGATDGVDRSNSYALEQQLGWSGILAEPNPVWHEALRRNRSARICERCVLDQSGRVVEFLAADHADLSTIAAFACSDYHAARRGKGRIIGVETISLRDLLREYGAPHRIDYMSIDTEGSEYDIIRSFDFNEYDVRLLSVEHNFTANRHLILEHLGRFGYVRRLDGLSGPDDWYIRPLERERRRPE